MSETRKKECSPQNRAMIGTLKSGQKPVSNLKI